MAVSDQYHFSNEYNLMLINLFQMKYDNVLMYQSLSEKVILWS